MHCSFHVFDKKSELNFDFELDFDQDPIGYQNASLTNLFYINNMMHDIWYQYGFDEESGNFQENNYGNSSSPWGSGDSVTADGTSIITGGFHPSNFFFGLYRKTS